MDEEWVTLGVGQNHFKYHCLGGGDGYSSKDDDVYYDFKTQEEFDKFEDEVSKKKLRRFRQLAISMGMQETFSRCVEIVVPDGDYVSAEMTKAIWQAGR